MVPFKIQSSDFSISELTQDSRRLQLVINNILRFSGKNFIYHVSSELIFSRPSTRTSSNFIIRIFLKCSY